MARLTRSAYAIGVVLRVFTPDRKIWKVLSVPIRMMTDADRPPPLALRKEIVRCTLSRAAVQKDITPTVWADESSTGPASLVLTDPDGNPILIAQHVPRPRK